MYDAVTVGAGPNGLAASIELARSGLSVLAARAEVDRWGRCSDGRADASGSLPALALIYPPLGLGLHTGIWATTRAPFFTFMAPYAAFVPWCAVYRWLCEKRPVPLRRMARIKPS